MGTTTNRWTPISIQKTKIWKTKITLKKVMILRTPIRRKKTRPLTTKTTGRRISSRIAVTLSCSLNLYLRRSSWQCHGTESKMLSLSVTASWLTRQKT